MAWVYKTYVRIVDGRKKTFTRRIWVPDKPTTKPTLPKDERDDLARASIVAAAAKRAAEARKRMARRRLWDQLHHRARDIRSRLAPSTVGKAPTVGAAASVHNPYIDEHGRKRSAGYYGDAVRKKYQADLAKKQADRAALDAAKKKIGDSKSGKTLERLVKEARERQKASNGQSLDTAYVAELDAAYAAHVKKVSSEYKKKVDEFKKYYHFTKNKDGTYTLTKPKSLEAWKKAQVLYKSDDFRALQSEYDRLFVGDGKKNLGSYTTAYTAYQQIADSQRQYIREAAKEAFFKGTTGPDDWLHRQQQWEKGEKWLYEQSAADIDPTKTSIVWERVGNGPSVPRHRTVQEEFEYRRSQYVAEMQRQYDNYKQSQEIEKRRLEGARMRMKRDMNRPGYAVKQYQNKTLADAITGLGMKKGPVGYQETENVVNKAMEQWDLDNKKWFLTKGARTGPRVIDGMAPADRAAYIAARDKARKAFYETLHAEDPGLLGGIMNLPGIKEGLATLGGIAGTIPSGVRATAYLTTGSSTIQIGINTNTLPEGIKKEYWAWVRAGQGPSGPGGLPLTTAPNPRNPLGIFGSGNAAPGPLAGESPLDKWLKTDEGKKWYEKYKADEQAVSHAQDVAFAKTMYGDGNLFDKMKALSDYGATPTNSDMANLASMFLDPSIALPLKFTTWPARLAHAQEVTKGITSLWGVKRAGMLATEFMKVTEADLRIEKSLAKYADLMKGVPAEQRAARAATIREMILAELAGIPKDANRMAATKKVFEKYGIDTRTANGHQLTSLVEERLAKIFEDTGIDYRDVAKQAQEYETKILAEEAADRAARSTDLRAADTKTAASELAAKQAADASSAKLAAERAATEAKLVERAARPKTILQRVQADPLQRPSTTVGHSDPVITEMVAQDPLRRAATQDIVHAGAKEQQSAATSLHLMQNTRETVTHSGVQFAPGQMTDDFLKSTDYSELKTALDDPDIKVRTLAQETLYEVGRRTMAESIARREGLQVPMKNGVIPWRTDRRGQSFTIVGGLASGDQYVTSGPDLLTRAGAHNPAEELVVANDRRIFEQAKIRALSLRKQLSEGKISREKFVDAMRDEVADLGIYRRSPDLSRDIQSGIGDLQHGDFESIVDATDDFIPVGGVMFEDLMASGGLLNYYETFSMLPEMMRGLDTQLMTDILNPAWRSQLTRGAFSKILSKAMFFSESVGPMQFRSSASHLFALFHLTLLDGDLKLLEQYSRSIETMLNRDPENIFGRMWKVMETRSGVPWADGFIESEQAFAQAAILGKRLHPNMALAMIPYGPIARHLPVGHGFTGHMRGLGISTNSLFKLAPASWRDASVVDALTAIASRRITTTEAVTKATQIAHYVADRYGSMLTRTRFTKVLQDFSIEASERTARGTFPMDELKARFIEARVKVSNIKLGEFDDGQAGLFFDSESEIKLANANAAQASAEFDSMFNRALRVNTKRREFPMLRRLYDDMYWANEISHDVPGLHTAKFFEAMQDPLLQRGDSWVRYADSYWNHMVASGAQAEAEIVLKTMFETELMRSARGAYEHIANMGEKTWGTKGAVDDFFLRTGLLKDARRVMAEGKQRVHVLETEAEQDIAKNVERDSWVIEDAEHRAAQADVDASMYDFADIQHVTIEAQKSADEYGLAVVEETTLLAQSGSKSLDVRVGVALKKFYGMMKKGEQEKARQFIHDLDPEIRARASVAIRKQQAQRGLIRQLNSVVHRTLDLKSIPTEVGKQMEELVEIVRSMEGGEAFLREWAEEYHQYLFRSRLIDYLKHEEWFKFQEVKGVVDPVFTEPRRIVEELSAARSKLNDPEKPLVGAARKRVTDEVSRLGAELEAARKAARDAGEARPPRVVPEVVSPPEPPRQPVPAELNDGRITMAQRGLEILKGMSEEEWLGRERLKAQRIRNTSQRGTPERLASIQRLQDIDRAFKVIEVAKSGGKGSFVPHAARTVFTARLRHFAGDRAKAVFAPKFVAPYVASGPAALVEQGRMLNRVLRNAPTDEVSGTVRKAGEVSDTYAKHGPAIEAAFAQVISPTYLKKYGFPEDLLVDITGTDLLTNLDEFARSLGNPRFRELVAELEVRSGMALRNITGDPSYTLTRWLDDRLVQRGEFFDARRFEQVDRIVADAIADVREGARRTRRTDLRRRPGKAGENPLTELVDTDVRAVIGKTKALDTLGISVHAYNEARKVLRTPMLRKRYSQQLVKFSTENASRSLYAAGHKVEDADWDDLFHAEYDKVFLAKREAMADEEALKMLEELGADEMFGSPMNDIIEEFERRYGMDMEVKGFQPAPITPYQRRTLEEAAKFFLGVDDLDDAAQMVDALQRHGQHPPFDNRAAMRDWLTKYGFWSPRTGKSIEAGKKSWSIQEEAKYYRDNWGAPPEWADDTLLEEGGRLRDLLFDERARGEQYRQWGLFNRNMEARFHSGNMTREERARFLVEGNEALDLKAKRDLPTERKYVIERYGRLVTDEAGNLTAFPELMHREELRAYITNTSVKNMPDGLIQTLEELDVVSKLIDKHIGTYFDEAIMAGKTVTYEEFFTITANVVHDLLKDPVWLKRDRDVVGKFLKGQAAFRRALVFTQIGFLMTNVIDTQIKGPWTSFVTRSFRDGAPASAKARSYGLLEFGFKRGGQLLRDIPVHGTERIRETESVLRKLQGITELPAQGAGMAEDFTKLRLAQNMYDGAYRKALSKLGDDELADAAARKFVHDEVSRLWPTVGDGPIERLFNTISPFISYQFKNHVVFLGELAGHPALFNYFNAIGNFIEDANRERWAKEHPNEVLPDNLARLIELPWAPGMFIDLGQFSDAQRGFKPLYDIVKGQQTVKDFMSNFVRLASANDINIVYGMLNALHIPSHMEYVQGRDEDGFPNGVWTQVEVPWEAPWGGTANALNAFWPVETATGIKNAMDAQFSAQAVTQVAFQTFFFGGLKTYDKGAGLNSYYFQLRTANPDAARKWLDETADGAALKQYWLDIAGNSKKQYTPQEILDIVNPPKADPNPWFHSKTKEFQEQVKADLDGLNELGRKWDNIIWGLTPGTEEYKNAKLMAATERYKYYAEHPELYEFFAFSMTPSEFAAKMDGFQTDILVQGYYDMKAPKASDYKTAIEWQKAVALWKKQREEYLKAFPQVAEAIGQARNGLEQVWRDHEEHWFDVLDQIGTRSVALEAARQSKDYDLVDQLYLANELDFETLGQEEAVHYFDPTTDFEPLSAFQKERDLEPTMRKDPFGHNLLPKISILPDFNKWRFDRMSVSEKADFERDQKYISGIKDVIAKAKASDNFGATFVRELKKHPELLAEYFRRNPGKREKWAANDEYIRIISRYGLLAKAGKFAEAGRYFDNLPDWVKARYFAKHPEKKQRLQQNLQYMNFMERWTSFYRRRDYSGGAVYFDKLPQWVKDRYYSNHPQGQVRGNSAYAKAMGKWVKLLQDGDKEGAKAYFDSLPQAYKDRYYARHPAQKLKNDIKRVGQLGEYFAADDANRALYLKENPEFAKWLKAQGTKESTRRMMILAAYQGLPKDDQWLRRVFREKYPEIFSQEAKGEQALRKTYNFLAEHPDMLPSFEKWLAAVWESYAENLKHTATPPKPIVSDHSRQRQHGIDRFPGRHTGRSAAWVRLHSI